MSVELVMPRAGLTMVEGTISAWTVPEGAAVKKGDAIMEFENEKNTIEFACTHDGYLHITAQEGDVVAVGAPIGYVAESQAEYQALCGGAAPAASPAETVPPRSSGAAADCTELVMPRAGLTMVEGTISAWTVPEGAAVKKGDAIMEFENEKNTIEFTCTHDGYLHITAQEGDVVAVGAPIGYVAATQAAYDALCGSPDSAPAAHPAAAPAEVPAAAPAESQPAPADAGGRVRITGLARKMAKQHQIPLAALRGTGPNGRIIAQDVKDYLEAAAKQPVPASAAEPAPQAAVDEVKQIPLTGIRRAIAKNMYGSLQEMAQCTAAVEVDVTDLLAYRQKLVDDQDFLGCKVTVNDLLSMATVKMLKKHPMANATFDGKTISVHSSVNLSIAVAAEAGLMVPVVKGADRMGLVELHQAMKDLADRARDKRLRDGDQTGGTFTVSNVGMFPIDWSTPIINPPQVAILGFGRSVKKMAVVNDEPKIRSMMNMFLTFDHRVFDGLEVGRILADMKTLVENPELITL